MHIPFFKVVPFLRTMKRDIRDAATDDAIDALRTLKVKVPVHGEDGDINTVEIPLISPEFRSIVENLNILYTSVYDHKAIFEDRVTAASRTSFAQISLKIAREKVDDFFASWNDYRKRHPIKAKKLEPDEDTADLINTLMGDDEDELPPAPAAAGGPAGSTSQA
jgi:hypothetical protein